MNLKAKAFIAATIGLFSLQSSAQECHFDQAGGLSFQFDHISSFDQFSVRDHSPENPVYPDWVSHPDDHSFLDFQQYFRRHAKLIDQPFLRKQEPVPGFAKKTTPVRYYRALVENCQEVWLRIDESNPEFARYFNVRDHKVDGNIPWLWEENTLNIRFTDHYKELQGQVGHTLTTVPVTDNTILPAYPWDSTKLYAVPEFTRFTLNSIKDNAFSVHGHLRSPYSLYVTDVNGQQWRIPWDPEYVTIGNPFKSLHLSEGVTKKDILDGNLVYGMSKNEVRLAWGAPHLERIHPILKDESTGRQMIRDENYLIDGLQKLPGERIFPFHDGDTVGQQTWWFYPERLEAGQYLVFDRHGKLKKSIQARNIYRKRIQPVEVAKDPIRE